MSGFPRKTWNSGLSTTIPAGARVQTSVAGEEEPDACWLLGPGVMDLSWSSRIDIQLRS